MSALRLIYFNSHRAKSGTVDGQELSKGHRLLARFFGVGPIDRTSTLNSGLSVAVRHSIPAGHTELSFEETCREVARDFVEQAVQKDVGLQLTWSGGIDSTVALIALRDAALERGELERLEVRYTTASISEYPRFFEEHIFQKLRARPADYPLPRILSPDVLTITGELGDQLFGSDYLGPLVKSGLAHKPYEMVVPTLMAKKLKRETAARRLLDYLTPQLEAAPVPIVTTFDYFWWLNFSLKWQMVSLRLPAFAALTTRDVDMRGVIEATTPFFCDDRFQLWSLSNPQVRRVTDWRSYKLEAKKVILKATDDFDYYATKEKQPSLKGVLVDRRSQGQERYRLLVREDYSFELERFRKDSA